MRVPPGEAWSRAPDDETGDALNADHSARRKYWLLIFALLAPAVVLPLWVPLYDRVDPKLGGFPFFFWFQIAMIGVAVVIVLTIVLRALKVDPGVDRTTAQDFHADAGDPGVAESRKQGAAPVHA